MSTQSSSQDQILARLDDLPFTKKHRKVLFASGIGWAFDAMDVGLITYIIAVLSVQWDLTGLEKSWIVSAGFIGMAIGASLGGTLADRIGRRNVFTLTLVVYGVATGASAFAGGVLVLILLRIVVGLGLGGELPIASTLVSELSPKKVRGSIVVWLEAFWALGWTVAAVVGYYVVPLGDWGWRVAFGIGALPALYAVYIRSGLPESPRFLLSQGKTAEAEAVVAQFEESARQSGWVPPKVTDEGGGAPHSTSSSSSLFAPGLRGRTVAIWTVWFMVNFAYYGAFIWIPSILYAGGFDLVKSFGYTLIITLAQLPGYAAAAFLIERWGRKPTLALFLAGSAVSAVSFGLSSTAAMIIVTGCFLSFFNLGAWGALYAVTPEIYPTSLRASGAGWAAGFGRIASIVAPFIVTALLAVGGAPEGNKGLLFAVLAGAFLIAALASTTLPEQRGKSLQD